MKKIISFALFLLGIYIGMRIMDNATQVINNRKFNDCIKKSGKTISDAKCECEYILKQN